MIDMDGLLAVGRGSSLVIGIGLAADDLNSAINRLKSVGCSAQLVGFANPRELVLALRNGNVDAAVRGVLSSSSTIEEIMRCFDVKEVMRTAVLEDHSGKPFMLTPVGIDEGRDKKERVSLARATVSYFEPAGWALKIGVLAKGRSEDARRGKDIGRSLEEGEDIAAELATHGIDAKHYGILFEDAIRHCDLIIAPDGVAGNLMFRSLHFVGNCKAYGAPVVNMDSVFVDTSRAKVDFVDSVLCAAGLAETRKKVH